MLKTGQKLKSLIVTYRLAVTNIDRILLERFYVSKEVGGIPRSCAIRYNVGPKGVFDFLSVGTEFQDLTNFVNFRLFLF